jgi:hypothetical protein
MAKVLTTSEIFGCLFVENQQAFLALLPDIERITCLAAQLLACSLHIRCGVVSSDDGMSMCAFSPSSAGQPLPDCMVRFDTEGEWLTREEAMAGPQSLVAEAE